MNRDRSLYILIGTPLDRSSTDPLEVALEHVEHARRRLEPFAAGRAGPAEYEKARRRGLPPAAVAFQIWRPPAPPQFQLALPQATFEGDTAEWEIGPSLEELAKIELPEPATSPPHKSKASPEFSRILRLYGYCGSFVRRLNQGKQTLFKLLLRAFSGLGLPKTPEVEALLVGVAKRVADSGPVALKAIDPPPTLRDVFIELKKLLAQGIPVTRDVFLASPAVGDVQEAREIQTEINLFELVGFRLRWCEQRKREHWYVASYHGQRNCVRHQKAGQMARYRRP